MKGAQELSVPKWENCLHNSWVYNTQLNKLPVPLASSPCRKAIQQAATMPSFKTAAWKLEGDQDQSRSQQHRPTEGALTADQVITPPEMPCWHWPASPGEVGLQIWVVPPALKIHKGTSHIQPSLAQEPTAMLQCAPQGHTKATSGQLLLAHTSPEAKSITTVGLSNWAESTQPMHKPWLPALEGLPAWLSSLQAGATSAPCKHGSPTTQACKSREQPTDSHQLSVSNAGSSPSAVFGHRLKKYSCLSSLGHSPF